MAYKIGEVSKMLGISVETIRYYESRGFIKPYKNKDNGYRYYDVWDINFLMEYKKYRSLEFTQNDILALQQTDSITDIQSRIISKENEITAKIQYYTLLSQRIAEIKNVINHIDNGINKYTISKSPKIYCISNRFDFEYNKENIEQFSKWTQYYPFVENSILINKGHFNWCFSITSDWAEKLSLDVTAADTIDSSPCLYTIIKSSPKGCFAHNIYKQILDYANINGYIISGNIIGNLILRTHEEQELIRYLELYIPIKL